MASVSAAAVCILCAAQPAMAPQIAQWQPIIAEASTRFAIPDSWIAHVIEAESGGRAMLNGKPIASAAGAMGLMQIMPGTFTGMQRRYGLGPDPYDPRTNILAGTAYLRIMYERYGYPNLFAAYQAGPARFDDFLLHQRLLPKATIAYVNRIVPGSFASVTVTVGEQNRLLLPVKNTSMSALFFTLGSGSAAANSVSLTPSNGSALFVPLSSRAR